MKTNTIAQLKATTASQKGITWSSSNPKICTVDQNGNIKAISAGTAKITAKLNSNGKTASCTVTVTKPVTKPAVTPPKAVTGVKKTAVSDNAAVFKWNKASGASGYQVYVFVKGKWVKKATTTKNYARVAGLTSAQNYYIRVRAYKKASGKIVYGNYSSNVKFCTKPLKPSKVSLSSKTRKTVSTAWKKSTGASGYQVQITSSRNLKGGIIRTTSKTSYKFTKNLKSGKTYYVRVRAYKTLGKVKYYSSWTTAKKIKTK